MRKTISIRSPLKMMCLFTVSGVTCRDDITVDVVTGSAYLTDSSCRSVISSGITGSISLNNVMQEVYP